mgnify:CR=1 FL=1
MYLNRLPKLIDGRVLIIEGLLDPVSESHDRDESEHSALNGLLGTRPLESANHHPSNRCRWISQTNYEDARERRHQRMGFFGGGGRKWEEPLVVVYTCTFIFWIEPDCCCTPHKEIHMGQDEVPRIPFINERPHEGIDSSAKGRNAMNSQVLHQ